MTKKPSVILVNIKRLKDWYVATSPDLQGLHVADSDIKVVIKEIPEVIKSLYRVKYEVEVDVEEASTESEEVFPLRYTTTAKKAA